MHVLRIPPARLEAFEQALIDRAGQPEQGKGEHERFRIRMGRWEVVGYDSGKITTHNEELLPVLEEVLGDVLEPEGSTVVGSDEAGKGEWLGPLTVAACAVPPDARARLVARGVMDSKELSSARVLEAARLVEKGPLEHETVLVSPSRFNALFPEFKGEGKGLNDLVAWAHAKAIGAVLDELPDNQVRVVVDEFDRVRTQARTQRAFDVDAFPVEQRVQAEDEIAVAAASVLAKAAHLRWIDGFEEDTGIPAGSMTMDEAREHEHRERFAKVDYL